VKNSAGSFAVALRALGQLLRALILVNNGMDTLIAKLYINSHAWTACVRAITPNPAHYEVFTDEMEDELYSVIGFFNQASLDQCVVWMDNNIISYHLKDLV
jgi:hypothetical protein